MAQTDFINKLNRINTAKGDIKQALIDKGQSPTDNIEDYASVIDSIPTGGSGDVKLFDTIENMQQDPNPQEGDLAVVYREEIQPVTGDSEFDSCVFPNEVVLSEAFTDSIWGSFRSTGSSYFDGMIDLSSSSFRFNGWGDSTDIRVTYTSNDGITYTRTDGGDELQEFGTTVKWESGYGEFNSVIGNFMKINGSAFEGIYKCNEATNYGKVKPIIITDKNTINDDVDYFNIDTIKSIFDNNLENFIENCSYLTSYIKNSSAYQTYSYEALYYYWRYFVWVINNNTADLYCYFKNTDGYISPFVYYNDITYLGASDNNISGTSSITLKITINLVNETMTWEDMTTTVNQYKTSGNHGVLIPFSFENKKIVAYYLKPDNSNWNYTSISYNTYNATSDYISTGFTQDLTTITSHNLDYKLELIYEYAKSQLSKLKSNELLPDKVVYSGEGVVTGDYTIYDNLDWNYIWNKFSLLPVTNHTLITSPSNTQPIITYNHNKDNPDTYVSKSINYDGASNIAVIPFNRSVSTVATKISLNTYLFHTQGGCLTIKDNGDKTFTSETLITGLSGFPMWVTYDNNYVYCLTYDRYDTHKLNLYKEDIINKTYTTLFSISITITDNIKGIVHLASQNVFIESDGGFYKISFAGTKTMIHSHSTWSNGNNISTKYILAYNGTSEKAELYDMDNGQFTGILTGLLSGVVTIDNKSYLFEVGSTEVKIIENGSISGSIQLEKAYSRASTTSSELMSWYEKPLSINGIVPLYKYVINTNNDTITYISGVISADTIILLYANGFDFVSVTTSKVNYRTGIDVKLDGTGDYIAICEEDKYNPQTYIRNRESQEIINNYTLLD